MGFASAAAAELERDVQREVDPEGVWRLDHDQLLDKLSRLWIRTKDRREVRLDANRVQLDILERAFTPKIGPTKLLVLKARQVGVSTLSQAWAYALTTRIRFTNAVTISHEADATQRLHRMQKFFLSRDDRRPVTTTNRIGAVTYAATEASHYIGTAGARAFGRGDTLHFIHCSELAFWPDPESLLTGLLEALTPDGSVVIESTPNGMGGHFYELWQNAPGNDWQPLFYPWWWEDEYRLAVDAEAVLPFRDDELALVEHHNLDHQQIAWRRSKQKELRDKFPQEYPEDAITCFLISGRPYFSLLGLTAQEANLREPIRTDGRGLDVWAEYIAGHRYVIGADVAEGLEGGDFDVAQVIDVTTGEQVARLRGIWPVDHFGRLLAELGKSYGSAQIAPERNNHGHAVLNTLLHVVAYPNLYRHFEYDPLMQTDQKYRWGWPTTTTTKPVMGSDLDAALIDSGGIKIRDRVTLAELRTTHWDGKGGFSAIGGCHDDCMMSLAIAWQLRKQPAAYDTAMEYFDQRNADPEHQKLVEKYLEQLNGPEVEAYLKDMNATTPKEG
ncbi:MAG TPA: hypothetical protein VGU71_22345 [Candidatus Dormibacteraeota bacterium]|nr:hypothetical protein [Candidatus Dormibacteraeota bacterium]